MATHLIGGEMTYTCLGGNLYEVSLTIYIDCDPETNTNELPLDTNVTITIYNSDYSYFDDFQTSNLVQSILSDETAGNECLEIPANLCILKGIYTDTIHLPPSEDGYILAHQRCCRNPSIINVPNPGDFGNTYTTNIPGTNLATECNSSPTFDTYPPLALCLGDDIHVDLSATDIDGDSLSYEFTTPFHGANTSDPFAITPPPFTPISWTNPYTEYYPVASSPALSINAQTGYITGSPNQLGMYIVGIKVNEYRGGALINSIIRDFRFLVVDCNVITSSILEFEWYCNGHEVQFINNSLYASTYHWDFGDNGASSTAFQPTHTYPADGNYTVTLIANPNTSCADTNTINFPILNTLNPFFEAPEPQCIDNNSFSFMAEGIIPAGSNFLWNFGPNANVNTSTSQNPSGISFSTVGTHQVSYTIINNECDDTYLGEVVVYDENIQPLIPFQETQCLESNSFNFSAEGIYPSNSIFAWDFGPDASTQFSSAPNTNNISFSTIGDHMISLLISANGCYEETTSNVSIVTNPEITISSSDPLGCEEVSINYSTNISDTSAYSYSWDLGNGTTANTASSSTNYTEGSYEISLDVVNIEHGCISNITHQETIDEITLPISDFSIHSDSLSWGEEIFVWDLSEYATELEYTFSTGYSTNEENPTYTFPSIGEYTISQYVENEFGCIDTSSLNLNVFVEYNIWAPNVFTPDDDNLNDIFEPVFHNIESYRLQIYSRWGEQLFDQEGEKPSWDGNRMDGSPCKQDTYIYYIEYFTPDNKFGRMEGFVILLR